ncbi:hypothetical protein ZIOFF_064347 [Zingiber officinale]|uniref:Uncharacterized protein n=1 Tax=Zingiber officinale TaxID=94328 RepID=A0A8J5EVV6_ZINOF|nr:hypothetical protein ZIOFF_064347 [Zingiber officinale]
MANGLIDAIAALVSSWSRHVSRATRKLSGRRRSGSPSDRRKKPSSCDEVDTDEDEGVWRREILMGEKCQPLDFSGAIYYDAFGRQRQEIDIAAGRQRRLPVQSLLNLIAFQHLKKVDHGE